ncbi:MAG: DHA2 family efflux MFS transporter permease subunit [Elusimicrobia bacterium]|nr:DHA2 family efflux MFS transporter permease subunit [Elusimicrobiota bacterium]
MSDAATPPAAPAQDWVSPVNPWIIAFAVMLATFMEVLDTSIANVALPHIAGSLSSTPNEATWVLTSYLVANAIVLPATGWLGGYFGRKRFLISCVIIFTVASALCGAAGSLGSIVLFRALQGAGGGALQPIAQSVLLESFPPKKRGLAMAVYGMGVVVAPIIGPTLGGWITDSYSWRWVFYINVPIGIFAITMIRAFVQDPPYLRKTRGSPIDYVGFGFMAVWLAAMQIVLDKGQEMDWFGTPWIRYLTVISIVAFILFIIREMRAKEPIVHLGVFKNRNFAVGTFLIFVVGAALYSTTAMLPLFLQTLMNYPAFQSGLAISPRGFGSLASMVVAGRLVGIIDDRALMAFGFMILAYSMYLFAGINLNVSIMNVIWPGIVNGFAMGFIFVPLTTSTMGELPLSDMNNGTGIYNLMRNVGGSVGISLSTTLLERMSQKQQANMVYSVNPYSTVYQSRYHGLSALLSRGLGAPRALAASLGMFYRQVLLQAHLLVYVDLFRYLTWICILGAPLCFLFSKVRHTGKPIAAH